MSGDDIFQPLALDKIKERVESLSIAYDLIAVTLLNGDILLGAVGKHWKWDGEIITLGFNSQEGKRFGYSHSVNIPIPLIADIQLIPLAEDSIPRIAEDDPQITLMKELGFADAIGQTDEEISRLPVQDYPNPWATIICEHNLPIIDKQQLTIQGLVERALSQDAIPPEGIKLETDFLLYADWDYFSHQIPGSTSISIGLSALISGNLTKDFSPSLNSFVLNKLKESWSERIRNKTTPQINDVVLMHGYIKFPEPLVDTEIEGKKCIVAMCFNNNKNDNGIYPVLFKVNLLMYPLEFLGRIISVLTFYGEALPVPINLLGKSYSSTLLVRAIAYIDRQKL